MVRRNVVRPQRCKIAQPLPRPLVYGLRYTDTLSRHWLENKQYKDVSLLTGK